MRVCWWSWSGWSASPSTAADIFAPRGDKPDDVTVTKNDEQATVRRRWQRRHSRRRSARRRRHHDGQGIHLQAVRAPAAGEGHRRLQADGGQHRRFALNVWAGWAPIILANDGFKAGKVWKTPDGKEFKVELVLIDNPVEMRDAYAAGDVHIGWAHARHGAAVRRWLRRLDAASRATAA